MLRIAQHYAGRVVYPKDTPKEVAFQQHRTCDASLLPGPGFDTVIQPEVSCS
jgi:hypothetical protein